MSKKAPPADKAIKSPPVSKSPARQAPDSPGRSERSPAPDPATAGPSKPLPSARVNAQPLMTSQGVKAPGEVFQAPESELRRYGPLVSIIPDAAD